VSAGFRTFIPVPPKTSLPITTPKLTPAATIHSGSVGGHVSGNSMPVTRNPSLISCFRTMAKRTSHTPPTAYDTSTMGSMCQAPCRKHWKIPVGSPRAASFWKPTLYMPHRKHGSRATITVDMSRLMSIASRTWGARRAVSGGTNRKVSCASNRGYSFSSLPPFLKCGFRLSSFFQRSRVSSKSIRLPLPSGNRRSRGR
jgi:hypothetical protein